MRCPRCSCEDLKVVDSRSSDNNSIRRRRECVRCHFRFTTYERCEEVPLTVIKSDGHKETFDRQKLMNGLVRATVKRDISVETLSTLIDDIEASIRDGGKTQVTSEEIGSLALQRLVDLDKVAYVRFASVYRDFQDIEEFSEELRSLGHE